MKTMKATILIGAVLTLAACAETSGPWRTLKRPVAVAGPTCLSFTSSIYFDQDSAALTPEARMVLANARTQAKGCRVESVRVIGLADAVGASEANLALSKRRADVVSSALAAHGFGKADFDLAAVGDAGARAPSGAAAPLRRRADIVFALASPAR
ncbi:OmpA family protein [Caulobacter segnis]|uniref:OmpA/MotB domain protein n=2 Tax=Caulobacter segnis TaxID=88688 RepID=D5VPM9_CAUST|nr:OmpA family protein [Caulobacter segnis]ADG12452.1 OmpA/MotB domain protein [Caulobacter segnis ATCC 21756]AVQ04037.1 OmpA family protein [Caulobacter segnis]